MGSLILVHLNNSLEIAVQTLFMVSTVCTDDITLVKMEMIANLVRFSEYILKITKTYGIMFHVIVRREIWGSTMELCENRWRELVTSSTMFNFLCFEGEEMNCHLNCSTMSLYDPILSCRTRSLAIP